MMDKILKGLYWVAVAIAAVGLLPLTLIGLWFWVKAEQAEKDAREATGHYLVGEQGDE